MFNFRNLVVPVLMGLVFFPALSCKSKDSGSSAPSSQSGGGGGGSGGIAGPSSLASAYLELPNSRPSWQWIDAQAAALPRDKPTFWKTLYFDVLRFHEEGTQPSDHTAETGQYQDALLAQYTWINMAPAPPIAPPWAQSVPPHSEIAFPFSGVYGQSGDLDDKLRGIATSILYARSKGVATRVSIMLPTGWNSGISISTEQEFRDFIDDLVVPQLVAFAKTAERTNSEYMGPLSIEADGLVQAFAPLAAAVDDAKEKELVQYYLDQAATAIKAHYSGTLTSTGTVNGGASAIDWTDLSLAGYDEIAITMSVPCATDPSPSASLTTQFERISRILDANPGKPWSVVELQPPYAICGTDRPTSFAEFRTALDGFEIQPVGIGLDIAPISTPKVNIDDTSLSEMSAWLQTKN